MYPAKNTQRANNLNLMYSPTGLFALLRTTSNSCFSFPFPLLYVEHGPVDALGPERIIILIRTRRVLCSANVISIIRPNQKKKWHSQGKQVITKPELIKRRVTQGLGQRRAYWGAGAHDKGSVRIGGRSLVAIWNWNSCQYASNIITITTAREKIVSDLEYPCWRW